MKTRHLILALCNLLLLTAGAARAAEWQWSVPDGDSRAYLWIPPDCQRVRAVVVASHNMIEQGILEHATMRKTLGELGIAEVWVVPYLDIPFDFNKGAGGHFERVMSALADESGYGELKFAPVVPLGHSACATFPWNFAAWNPGRTLAVLSVHGDAPQTGRTGYGRPNVDWGARSIDGVPGLMVMGEYEWGEVRLDPAFSFMERHPGTPLAFRADAGRGHFDYSDELVSFLAMFIRKSAAVRLPADAALDKPVVLKPVDPGNGWRVDRWRKDQPPAAPAAPYAEYKGNPREAFWCFDKEMAAEIEAGYAAARGKKPQLVSVFSDDMTVEKGCGEPVNPRFVPAEDGVTFRLKTAFLDTVPENNSKATFWTGLPAGSPLGNAGGAGSIRLSRIVGPFVQKSPDTFAYSPGRAEYTANRRNQDIWVVASHPGDAHYKSAVQQAMLRAVPNTDGAPQRITFPEIPDQADGVKSLKLNATSDAGVRVSYYVREGPAEIAGDTIKFTPIPPRARFPVKVTVVAWQPGRAAGPKIQAAECVGRTFLITRPRRTSVSARIPEAAPGDGGGR
jgi:hypothetical protein